MNKLSLKLKRVIRKWLGLGETFIGIDMAASQRDQSCIVVVSRLNNGSVRIIDCRFKSIREMENLVRDLQQTYGVSSRDIFADIPYGLRHEF